MPFPHEAIINKERGAKGHHLTEALDCPTNRNDT